MIFFSTNTQFAVFDLTTPWHNLYRYCFAHGTEHEKIKSLKNSYLYIFCIFMRPSLESRTQYCTPSVCLSVCPSVPCLYDLHEIRKP